MVSWSVAAVSKRQENRQKTLRFCSRYSVHPFADRGASISGENKIHTPIPVLSGSHSNGMALLFRMTVLTPIIVPIAQKPSHGSQRKNAEARSGVPLVWGYRSPERASALSYFQSLRRSSMALSRAVFIPFSMMLIISFSRMDYCFFLFFFFFSFSRSEV